MKFLVITKREIKGYFNSSQAYIFMGCFLVISGFIYTNFLVQSSLPAMHFMLANFIIILILITPLITMKLFTDEKKLGTEKLIFSSPISVFDVVFGKFIASFFVIAITLFITISYTIMTSFLGNVDIGPVVTSYIGLLLLGGAFCSVGIFASSLTENQIIASIISFSIILLLWLSDFLESIFTGIPKDIINTLSIFNHLIDFQRGVLSISNIIYYISFIAVFLYLTILVIKTRWMNKLSRTNSFIFTISTIFILIIINLIIGKININKDFTKNKINSLSNESVDVLETIDKDVSIYYFYDNNSALMLDAEQLLQNIKNTNKNIDYRMIDLYKEPTLAKKYQIDSSDTALLMHDEKKVLVRSYDMLNTDYNTATQSFDAEKTIVQSIVNITNENIPNIYVLQGHGELDIDSDLAILNQILSEKGNNIKPLNLLEEDIPLDADILYIIAPIKDYTKDEIDSLYKYLDNGGDLLLGFDMYTIDENLKNLKDFSLSLGVEIKNNFILDPKSNYKSDIRTILPIYESHEITEKMVYKNLSLIFPASRGLSMHDSEYTINTILKTSSEAWGEENIESDENISIEDYEQKGNIPLAVSLEKETANGKSKIIIIGNSYFASNDWIIYSGNSDFFLEGIPWFYEDAIILDIPSKNYELEPLVLNEAQINVIFIMSVFVIPFILFFMAFITWIKRRSL